LLALSKFLTDFGVLTVCGRLIRLKNYNYLRVKSKKQYNFKLSAFVVFMTKFKIVKNVKQVVRTQKVQFNLQKLNRRT